MLRNAQPSALLMDELYQLNSGKLIMPVNKRYPVDKVAVEEWIGDLANFLSGEEREAVLDFALVFQQNMQYISFDTFYRELRKCAMKLRKMCIAQGREILLLVPEQTSKSNFWVALMIWPIIRQFVTQVVVDFDMVDWSKVQSKDSYLVYVDDASFTGSQASESIWFQNFPDDKRAQLCFIIPFVSELARKRILDEIIDERFEYALFIHSEIELKPLSAFFTEEKIQKIQEYPGFVNLRPGQCMAYFDHKMPDQVSTTDFIFLFAPVYLGPGVFKVRSLVQNCDVTLHRIYRNRPNSQDELEALETLETQVYEFLTKKQRLATLIERDGGVVCPPAFYRTIPYKWPDDKSPEWSKLQSWQVSY
jgi:hypothetical protein